MKVWVYQEARQVKKRGADKAAWYVGWYDTVRADPNESNGQTTVIKRCQSCGPGKEGRRKAEALKSEKECERVPGVVSPEQSQGWTLQEAKAHGFGRDLLRSLGVNYWPELRITKDGKVRKQRVWDKNSTAFRNHKPRPDARNLEKRRQEARNLWQWYLDAGNGKVRTRVIKQAFKAAEVDAASRDYIRKEMGFVRELPDGAGSDSWWCRPECKEDKVQKALEFLESLCPMQADPLKRKAKEAGHTIHYLRKALERAGGTRYRHLWTEPYWWLLPGQEIPNIVPRWDASSRQLWIGNRLLKCFDKKALNIMRVLEAFQREQWKSKVDSPFSPMKNGDDVLHDTCRHLNKSLGTIMVFKRDGSGKGVCWGYVSP